MREQGKETKPTRKQSTFQKIENLHPHLTLTYLLVGGITLVFLFLFGAFTFSAMQYPETHPNAIPKAFAISSLVLLGSSFVMHKVKYFFEHDDAKGIKNYLAGVFVMGTIFCVLQVIGWKELQAAGSFLNSSAVEGYLYLLSGLHMAHLIGGMVFLGVILLQVIKVENDPVQALMFFTNPYQKLRLKILGLYWHFMDALWLSLFLYFLFWL